MTRIPLQESPEHVYYMDKPNLLTKSAYVLPYNAEFGEEFYTELVLKSNTLGSLVRNFMIIIQALVNLWTYSNSKNEGHGTNNDKGVLTERGMESDSAMFSTVSPIQDPGKI